MKKDSQFYIAQAKTVKKYGGVGSKGGLKNSPSCEDDPIYKCILKAERLNKKL